MITMRMPVYLFIGVLVQENVVEVLEQSRQAGSLGEVRDAVTIEDRVTVEKTALPSIL